MKSLFVYLAYLFIFFGLLQFFACKKAKDIKPISEIEQNLTLRSSCLSSPSGLIAWYDGDAVSGNIVFDIQGSHDGTLKKGTATSPGLIGNAFSFDGYDDYITIPDSELNGVFESGSDFSINLWAYKIPNRVSPALLSLMTPTSGCNVGLVYFFYGNGASSTDYGILMSNVNTCTTIASAREVTGIAHNEWVFLSVVYENKDLFLYADGQLVKTDLSATQDWIKPNPSKAGGLMIGTSSHTVNEFGSQHHFQGLIDEIQIFDRALSAEEINAVFESNYGICKDITICHKPGTPAEKLMKVPVQALDAHLGHGDLIGPCE